MPRPLYVHLNRSEDSPVEPETLTYTTVGTFSVVLKNHGQPAHVHLHPDDALAEIARVEESNPYVPAHDRTSVHVGVADGATGEGELDIVTGYGSESETVAVVCEEPSAEPARVSAVTTDAPDSDDGERSMLTLGLFAAIGVLVAVGLMLVSETAAILVGGLALLVLLVLGGYLLTSTS